MLKKSICNFICVLTFVSTSILTSSISASLELDEFYGGPTLGLYNFGSSDYGGGLKFGGVIEKQLAPEYTLQTELGLVRAIDENDSLKDIVTGITFGADVLYPIYPHEKNMVYASGGLHYESLQSQFIPQIGLAYFMPLTASTYARFELKLGQDLAIGALYIVKK